MSTTTKTILIEITSSSSIEICKNIMEELFKEMLNAGIVTKSLDENANEAMEKKIEEMSLKEESNEEEDPSTKKLRHTLVLQQVKIVDTKGKF